jgi:copper chaperone
MSEITLEAPDISCDHCISSIEKAVAKLAGVRFISGDPDGKRVTLEYDPARVDLRAIETALEEEGYPVAK